MTTDSAIAGTAGDAATSTEPTRRGLPRRTLVAGTAWAVPAVIVASAAPAVAASSSACPRLIGVQSLTGPGPVEMQLGFDIRDPDYVLTPIRINPTTNGFALPPPKHLTVNNVTAAATVTYTWDKTRPARVNVTLTFKLVKGDVVCTSDLYSATLFL